MSAVVEATIRKIGFSLSKFKLAVAFLCISKGYVIRLPICIKSLFCLQVASSIEQLKCGQYCFGFLITA